jgi:hypothetical protein
MIKSALAASIIFGLFLPLPAQSPPAGWKGSVEIRDGVRTVKNPAEPLHGRITLSLEEDLVIGNDKDAQTLFFMKISVAVDRSGNIFIWDPDSFRIQKFEKSGRYLRTIGKKGEGPGEFMSPYQLRFQADEGGRLYVWDNAKIHLFSVDGGFERSIPISPSGNRQFAVLSSGSIIRDSWEFDQDRMSETVVLIDRGGKTLKRVAGFPSQKFEAAMKDKARFTVYYPELVLSPWTRDAALFGFPSEYRITAVDGRGETILAIERAGSPARFTSAEKGKLIDEFLAGKRAESRAALERQRLVPDFWPFFDAFFADERGRIFVRRMRSNLESVPETVFDLFSPEGFYLREVTVAEPDCLALTNGFLYSRRYDREKECDRLFRYRVANWTALAAR